MTQITTEWFGIQHLVKVSDKNIQLSIGHWKIVCHVQVIRIVCWKITNVHYCLSRATASEIGCGIYDGAPHEWAGVIDNVGYVGAIRLNVGGESSLPLRHATFLGLAVSGKESGLPTTRGDYHQHILPLGVDNNLKDKRDRSWNSVMAYVCVTLKICVSYAVMHKVVFGKLGMYVRICNCVCVYVYGSIKPTLLVKCVQLVSSKCDLLRVVHRLPCWCTNGHTPQTPALYTYV